MYFFFPVECGRHDGAGCAAGPGEAVSFGITVWGPLENISNRAYASNFYIHSTLHILRKMKVFSGGVDISLYVPNFYLLGNILKSFKRLRPIPLFKKEF